MMIINIKYLAHAAFEIKPDNKVIYVDLEQYSEASDKADVILVTHSHTDHCDPEKITTVQKPDTTIIAPADCASKLGNIKTLKPGEKASLHNITFEAVEAYNIKRFRSPGVPYHPKGFGVGYLIKVGGKTIYHAGDTDFIPEMRQLGKIDVALLPTGDTYTMDNSEAAEAAITVNPKIAIPMHRWKTDPREFKKAVQAKTQIKVELLKEGEELRLNDA